jgi:hypothetical protein
MSEFLVLNIQKDFFRIADPPDNLPIKKCNSKSGRGCWYKIYTYECPVCGSYEEIRERKYTEKPKDHELRYSYKQQYCGCLY